MITDVRYEKAGYKHSDDRAHHTPLGIVIYPDHQDFREKWSNAPDIS